MLHLVRTSEACPEQYDVYLPNEELVGYIRLRHGMFRVDRVMNDKRACLHYEKVPNGWPHLGGMFPDPDERKHWLRFGCLKIMEAMPDIFPVCVITATPPEKKE